LLVAQPEWAVADEPESHKLPSPIGGAIVRNPGEFGSYGKGRELEGRRHVAEGAIADLVIEHD
jgi:hypothetical protein